MTYSEHELHLMKHYGCDAQTVEVLRLSPSYTGWGPVEGNDVRGPNGSRTFADWDAFLRYFTVGKHPAERDDRSGGEIVNWKFSIARNARLCRDCDGSGYNVETKRLSDAWYGNVPRGGWRYDLTQDEVDVLLERDRLSDLCSMIDRNAVERVVAMNLLSREEAERRWDARDTTRDHVFPNGEIRNMGVRWRDQIPAAVVNAAYRTGLGHDTINQWICVRTRAERLGVFGHCPSCKGSGDIFTEPKPRLCLVLWVINPETGQSYYIEITSVKPSQVPVITEHVRAWGQRLAQSLAFSTSKTLAALERGVRPRGFASSLLNNVIRDWSDPVVVSSWKALRSPRDAYGDLLPPDTVGASPAWEPDDINELVALHVEGRTLAAWFILTRIGCSRLVKVAKLDEDDVTDIVGWAERARERTLERFSCTPKLPEEDSE